MSKVFLCPLINDRIDSTLCLDVQDCIDGVVSPTIAIEDFLEQEDCYDVCLNCKYHL